MTIIFALIGASRQVPPLETVSADPVEVAEEVRRHARLFTDCRVIVDLDVHGGNGILTDGREPLGEFIVPGAGW